MITFLPYEDFERSAQVLDDARLGKQRAEAVWHLSVLAVDASRPVRGYRFSLQLDMWRGYAEALVCYTWAHCREWAARGFQNTELTVGYLRLRWPGLERLRQGDLPQGALPPWLGRPELHASHRANLLRKRPDLYERYGWLELPQEGYWWPTRDGGYPSGR